MDNFQKKNLVKLNINNSLWDHFFTVAPLIVVGSKEGYRYDLAPKHMASPIGQSDFFGFVCTPKHSTYQNIKKNMEFSVSFPVPDQIVMASLSASPRCEDNERTKLIVDALSTFKCNSIDALLLKDAYLFFECELYKIIDGFNDYSIITGRIIDAFVNKDYLKVTDKDIQDQINERPLLAYIANGRFAKIKKTYKFPFPKGFKK
ncbi:MAG: flavin reductase [Flavobacteriaceae bacterium]|nr:flavin reductase [Flavobacteriaceae bacterium]